MKSPSRGTVVSDKYRLLRPLGKGGMGLVFEAEHLRLGQRVAIKFLRPDLVALPDACSRFEREARASARLRGPHVVQVLDVDTDRDGLPYIVMERVTGRDLEAELRARGRLPIAEAVDCVLQACAALTEAHSAGIVHRDLKPSNLFLADECGTRVLKVLDFGISKISHEPETSVTSAAITLGTPLYMSPEQVRSSKDVDERSDIWSLGVILYELLAGSPPFSGSTTAAIAAIVADAVPSLGKLRPEIPMQLDRVIARALAKSPSDRYPSAEMLAAALLPFASSGAAPTPLSPRQPPARALHLSDAIRTFAGTLALGVAIASGLALGGARAAPGAAIRRPAGAPTASGAIQTVSSDLPQRPGASASSAASRATVRNANEPAAPRRTEPIVQIAAVAPPSTALVSPEPPPASRRTSTTSPATVQDPQGHPMLAPMRE
ncbi:MAG TPA: protein kinase [Polyangiaceae bacterium]|nr:protein kinase [Polyangiaceae bacterium]